MKPMLACDYVKDKLVFPAIAQPKIDGVRGLNLTGKLTGRSLEPFGNKYATRFFSHPEFKGFDGELAAAHECDPALCRTTTSALATHEGEPFLLWWLFDYVTEETARLRYAERYESLVHRVQELLIRPMTARRAQHLRVVPSTVVHTLDELTAYDEWCLEQGYEGTIVRNPSRGYKYGRSTPTEGGLLRIKQFVDFEFRITKIIEGESNQNEATINALGLTERSTHQANMVPNGMVGALEGTVIGVVKDGGRILFDDGAPVRVGAGRMNHSDRKLFFERPELILGQIGKAKTFPRGIKDKLRFPTFQTLRMKEDL
jgi:DNA ligase 1